MRARLEDSIQTQFIEHSLKKQKRFAVQYVNFVPSISHQAGVVMSGYTVVLTGNLFDHVLCKTLGLPSLNGHEKLKAFSAAFGR